MMTVERLITDQQIRQPFGSSDLEHAM